MRYSFTCGRLKKLEKYPLLQDQDLGNMARFPDVLQTKRVI